jgi:hypothetical protein
LEKWKQRNISQIPNDGILLQKYLEQFFFFVFTGGIDQRCF